MFPIFLILFKILIYREEKRRKREKQIDKEKKGKKEG